MKIQNNKLALSLLSALLVSSALVNPAYCGDKGTVKTEAGGIDFSFLNYMNKHPGIVHKIVGVIPEDNLIQLNDGSMWTVSKPESVRVGERIVISRNKNRDLLSRSYYYGFAGINPESRSALPMDLQIEPTPGAKEGVFFVKDVDIANNVLTLNDGTRWVIYASDHGTLDRFRINDRIIIGVNTKDPEKDSPFLLIDTTSRGENYVKASLIN